MLECVLAFPLILTLMLGCMQIAHIWVAREVTVYAAYCAARATLVCQQGEYQGAAGRGAGLRLGDYRPGGRGTREVDSRLGRDPGLGRRAAQGAGDGRTDGTVECQGDGEV